MSERSSKRRKKSKEEETGDVVIDIPVISDTKTKKDKKQHSTDEAGSPPHKRRNRDTDDSPPRKRSKKPVDEEAQTTTTKGSRLKQSRRWDQEDLETIVPEAENSSDEEDSIEGSANLLSVTQTVEMTDEEKSELNWLTGVLPDQLLLKVAYYLHPLDIDQGAITCKRLNGISHRRDVWSVYQKEWTHVTTERFNSCRNRSQYAQLYNTEIKRRNKIKQDQEDAEARQILAEGAEWAKAWMILFFFNRSIDYLSLFSFILGTCFAAARCQGAVLWDWRLVLLPFYIPLFQLFAIPAIYDICRLYYGSTNVSEVVDDNPFILWHLLFAEYRPLRPMLYFMNLNLLAFWILLMIKLNARYGLIPAGVVIIPLLLFALALFVESICGIASGNSFADGSRWDRLFVIFSTIIISTTLVLVVLKLDGVIKTSWHVSLIPLWVYFGFLVLFPLIALICAGCSWSCRQHLSIARVEDPGFAFFAWLLCMTIIAAPIFTWFLLVSLNLDGISHRSWPIVFIPIFVLEGGLILFCGFLDLINITDG